MLASQLKPRHASLRTTLVVLTSLLLALAGASCGDDGGTSTSDAGGAGATTTAATGGSAAGGTSASGGSGGASSTGGTGGSGGGNKCAEAGLLLEYTSTASQIDLGYTGLNHRRERPLGTKLPVELYDCDDQCRICKLRGPIATNIPGQERRCVNDSRQVCDQDSDCTALGGPVDQQRCLFPFTRSFLSAPAPICLSVFFEPPAGEDHAVAGSFDLFTGEIVLDRVRSVVGQTAGFCQQCENDASPFDGNKDGTCSTSGAACDVTNLSQNAPAYTTSHDCALIDEQQNRAYPAQYLPDGDGQRNSNTSTASLKPDSPFCGAAGLETVKCMCGLCDDNLNQACSGDSDCPNSACSANGFSTRPNVCLDECLCGPDGNCGCTNAFTMSTAPCFPPNDILLPGSNQKLNGFYSVVAAALLCFPSSGVPQIDQGVGLPGPLRLRDALRITVLDASVLMP